MYLTGAVGEGTPGGASPVSWLGRAEAIAGLTVALLAPVTGVWVQASRLRREVLAVLTGLAVAVTASMSLIRDDPAYLFAGLALLAVAAACGDLASVPYNALLRQLSTSQTSGRISGMGWAAGYFGSVLLLVLVYFGFIAGDGPERGFLSLSTDGGENIRMAMLLAAAWFAVFALPLLLTVHRWPRPVEPRQDRIGLIGAYRKVWTDVRAEWRRDHNLVYYLVSSAVFRDGLAGVFAFGAVLGVSVYGLSEGDVLIFGIAACVVAAIGAVVGGLVDDRVGSKPVIVTSLVCLILTGLTLLSLSGTLVFWVCGLLLCLFIGPTQSSARTQLLRMTTEGREGVAFGLYTMTGRAVSFLAPWMFFMFIDAFGTDRAGTAGLCVVLGVGLLGMVFVKVPAHVR
ncbi:MFS transporter [Mycolicibacterium murale]|uniref:MFS transporter n=1 Tax=Mycolicibacterium murale TaxID=182220 RepID=A0A7I9WKJ0_9MYCO|nr:MFS transporter [Mycolicibacterium murale]